MLWLPLFSFIESESIYEMLNVCAPAIRICVNKVIKSHLQTPGPKSRTRYGYNTHRIAAQIFKVLCVPIKASPRCMTDWRTALWTARPIGT